MAFRRLLAVLWLAVALVVAQQAAALHDLGHATEQLTQKDSWPAPSSCDAHFLCAQLSGAAAAFVAAIVIVTGGESPASISLRDAPSPVRLAFRSRAPPTSSV